MTGPGERVETTTHLLPATVHGRYLLHRSGDAGLLVGFHGYGEGAEDHLEALLEVPGVAAWTVASVQALHPFYNRRTGEVVASWMTKQDRLAAIEDNVRYVADVVTGLRDEGIGGPLVYEGFSQGVAMAYRAAAAAGHPSAGLAVLAGDVPPDVAERDPCPLPPVLVGCGARDDAYDETRLERDVARLESKGVPVTTCVFDGGHEWTGDYRRALRDFLAAVRERQSA